jgi:hypothetical protein
MQLIKHRSINPVEQQTELTSLYTIIWKQVHNKICLMRSVQLVGAALKWPSTMPSVVSPIITNRSSSSSSVIQYFLLFSAIMFQPCAVMLSPCTSDLVQVSGFWTRIVQVYSITDTVSASVAQRVAAEYWRATRTTRVPSDLVKRVYFCLLQMFIHFSFLNKCVKNFFQLLVTKQRT